MAKTPKKQHEKEKFETGVVGPDGVFYSSGSRGEVQLVKIAGLKGMFWSHKTKDLTWRKVKNDEIRKKV